MSSHEAKQHIFIWSLLSKATTMPLKGAAKSSSPWMQHIAATRAKMPGKPLKEVLKAAARTYKKG